MPINFQTLSCYRSTFILYEGWNALATQSANTLLWYEEMWTHS